MSDPRLKMIAELEAGLVAAQERINEAGKAADANCDAAERLLQTVDIPLYEALLERVKSGATVH